MKLSRILAAAFLAAASPSYADQNSISVPESAAAFQSAFGVPDNLGNVAHWSLNPALKSIASNFSGTACTSIANPVPFQWCVTSGTPTVVNMRIGSSWVPIFNINGTSPIFNFGFTALNAANNLSDIASAASARSNLGLAPVAASGSAADLTGTLALARLPPLAASNLTNGVTGTGAIALAVSPVFTGQPTITPTAPNWGTLNDIYAGLTVNLGALPKSAMDTTPGTGGTQSMPYSILAALDVPATLTHQGFIQAAVGGYGRTASTAAAVVGLFGSGMANAANTDNWGLNTICTNTPNTVPATKTGFDNVQCYSIEADVNIFKLPSGAAPSGTVRALGIFSGSEAVPTGGAYAIEVGPFTQNLALQTSVVWNSALIIDQAPNGSAMFIQPSGWGTGSPGLFSKTVGSQPIQFAAVDSANGSGTNTITAATWAATGSGRITFTTSAPHGITGSGSGAGAIILVTGNTPSGYNGAFVTLAGTTGSTIVAGPLAGTIANPGTITVKGTVYVSGNNHFGKISIDPTGTFVVSPDDGGGNGCTALQDGAGGNVLSACAAASTLNSSLTISSGLSFNSGNFVGTAQCGKLTGARFDSTTDQPITIHPPSTPYWLTNIRISNPSAGMTAAVGGIYTGAGKTGTQLVAAGTSYTGISTAAANTSGNALSIAPSTNTTATYNLSTIYFSLTTGESSVKTADIIVNCAPIN